MQLSLWKLIPYFCYHFTRLVLVVEKTECVWLWKWSLVLLTLEWDKLTQNKPWRKPAQHLPLELGRRGREWEALRKIYAVTTPQKDNFSFSCLLTTLQSWFELVSLESHSLFQTWLYCQSSSHLLVETGACLRLPGGQQGAESDRSKPNLDYRSVGPPSAQQQMKDLDSILLN